MSKHFKMIVKEFKKSVGRFIAILAIIAVGVGFLVGVTQATPDMKYTMDNFYDSRSMYDVQIKSTFGLLEDDILAIKGMRDVEAVIPLRTLDTIVTVDERDMVARVTELDFNQISGMMNRFDLIEGSYPSKSDECVVEAETGYFSKLSVGDVLRVKDSGNFNVVEYKVKGIVRSPLYYAKEEKERSAEGNGRLGTAFYVPKNSFHMTVTAETKFLLDRDGHSYVVGDPIYTDCYVQLIRAKTEEAFSKQFERILTDGASALATLGFTRNANLLANFIEKASLLPPALAEKIPTEVSWYVLDRTMNTSYASMGMNIDKVSGIAGIFPIFFILVAALVALTTMTKMVEEDRAQIGMLKAVGYSKGRILAKYLLYCGLATLLGIAIGALCGFSLLPNVLWQAYSTLYVLPKLQLQFSWLFALIVALVGFAAMSFVTVVACLNSLRSRPAELMQPKAPKAGKRILLERITPLWRHIGFKYKAMLRNIFRYKKNMFMTILGVAGCTALIVTGFGIQGSVQSAASKQFADIYHYDLTVDITSTHNFDEPLAQLLRDNDAKYFLHAESATLEVGLEKESVTAYVADSDLKKYINMHTRGQKRDIPFDENAVVIPENVAKACKIKTGDDVTVRVGDKTATWKVTAIMENYINTSFYVNRALYERFFAKTNNNTVFLRTGYSASEQDIVTEKVLKSDMVSGMEFTSQIQTSYNNLLSTMKLITIVLIACAGALAIIVLYNLTNINIDERKRELAALKVLGYRPIEIAGYVYRESLVLTVVGALFGLGLGALLHMFVIVSVETIGMMFGRGISFLSYLFSFLITLVFAGIVDALLARKLSNIRMHESMKAID